MLVSALHGTQSRRRGLRGAAIGVVFVAALAATGLRAEEPSQPPAAITARETSERKPDPSPPATKTPARKRKPSKKFLPSERIDAESVISFPADI